MLPTAISVNQKPSIINSHQNIIHKDPKIIDNITAEAIFPDNRAYKFIIKITLQE